MNKIVIIHSTKKRNSDDFIIVHKMLIVFVLFQLAVALAMLEDLGSHPVGVGYEMTLSGAVGTTVAVVDTVGVIM